MSIKKWVILFVTFFIVVAIVSVMNIPIVGALSLILWVIVGIDSARVVLKWVVCGLLLIELLPSFVCLYRKVRNERL